MSDPVTVSVLTHRPTGYYMVFGGRHMQWSPGHEQKVEYADHYNDGSIIAAYCEKWLSEATRKTSN